MFSKISLIAMAALLAVPCGTAYAQRGDAPKYAAKVPPSVKTPDTVIDNTASVDTADIDNTASVDTAETAKIFDSADVPIDLPGPGVRTPGFWGSPNGLSYWDGIAGGNKGTLLNDEFPDKDLAFDPDNPGNAPGSAKDGDEYILIGDLDSDGTSDAGETTIKIALNTAQAIINASNKDLQDMRYVLLRDAIATQLNFNAGNPGASGEPGEDLTEAVAWLKKSAPLSDGELLARAELTSNTAVKANSLAWQSGFTGIESGSSLHNDLDQYNNSGEIGFTAFAQDGDVTGSTAYKTSMATYLASVSSTG